MLDYSLLPLIAHVDEAVFILLMHIHAEISICLLVRGCVFR